METDKKAVILVGMGGHALVVADALRSSGRSVTGYCDRAPRAFAGNSLAYLGTEDSVKGAAALAVHPFLVTIGENERRRRITASLTERGFGEAMAAVHLTAVLGSNVIIGRGTQVQAGVFVNADSVVGRGVILNTACIIEHDCRIGDFAHVAPGAVLAGNVTVGEGAFVGANATVIQGVTIGEAAVVGAGTVVLRDVPTGRTIVGNPGRLLPE